MNLDKLLAWQKIHGPWNKGKKTGIIPRTAFKKGVKHPNQKGRKHTEEEKEKVRQTMRKLWKEGKIKDFTKRGAENHLWKGGITPINRAIRESQEYKLWRKAVYERDNYTCIWCFQKGGDLEADHIKPFCYFPELRFAIDNGRTLCVKCHRTTETYGHKVKRVQDAAEIGDKAGV